MADRVFQLQISTYCLKEKPELIRTFNACHVIFLLMLSWFIVSSAGPS